VERTIVLPAGVDITDADTVTIERDGELITGRVRVVERRMPPAGAPGTLRVTLDLAS
jgi:hypothetical protein